MAADPALKQQVEQAIADNRVLLFMKGTPEMPRCGFSMRVVGVLEQLGVDYGAIDVLPALQPLREVTAELSDWQTFPQLYVQGELVGGADIVEEMLDSGELGELLGVEQPAEVGGARAAADPPRRVADEPADAARLSGPWPPRRPSRTRAACWMYTVLPLGQPGTSELPWACADVHGPRPGRAVHIEGGGPGAQPSTRSAASSQRAISSSSRARARSWRADDRAERSGLDQCTGSASSSSSRLNEASASSTSRSSRASSALRFLLGPAARRRLAFGARAFSAPAASSASAAERYSAQPPG